MFRKLFLLTFFAIHCSLVHAGDFAYFGLLDIRVSDSDNPESWLANGFGPFRYDEESNAVNIGHAMLTGKWAWNKAHSVTATVSAYDDTGATAGINELFYSYQSDAQRWQFKLGSFFPEISLENTGPGWTTRIPLTNSAINSWIGEEVRINGAQVGATWHLTPSWQAGFTTAAFNHNDPAGAMLSWRGWALHDRQTRIGEQLPITDIPTLGVSGGFNQQELQYEPFVEVDNRIGATFSVFAKQQNGNTFKYYHYDNRGEPTSVKHGQYAWDTQFDHLGLLLVLPHNIQVKSQWLTGETFMGDTAGLYVHNEFESWFISTSKVFEDLSISLRYDDFEVKDLDGTIGDNNTQDGSAWTLSLRYDINPAIAVLAEYINAKNEKMARMYFSEPALLETQLSQLAVQWRF